MTTQDPDQCEFLTKEDLGEMIITISHHLRSPLTPMIALSSILAMQYSGTLNDEQLEQLNIIKDSSENLLTLINDVTDLARLESNNIKTLIATTTCKNIIEMAAHPVIPIAEQKGLKLIIDLGDEDISLATDISIAAKIIFKLIENTIKFSNHGEIKVRYEIQKNINSICFHVTDTNTRIKPEDSAQLFKPFSDTKELTSAGLGPYTARRLARLLNGNVTYISESSKDSRFTFSLPYLS